MIEGPQNAAALIEDLESADKPVIRRAVAALISLAARSPELAVQLGDLLRDPQRKNPWSIAYVLAHLPHPSSPALEVLRDSLDHSDSDIRWAIALKLTKLANSDHRVFELLLELLAQGTPTQKRMATYCVRDLKLADRASLAAIVHLLSDPHPAVRVAASTSLKERSDCDDEVKKRLLEVFVDDLDGRVRNAAAITLAQLGTPSAEFLTALNDAVHGTDIRLAKAAEAALGTLKRKGPISHGDE